MARILRRWTLLILIIALDMAALVFWFENGKAPYYQSEATIELTEVARNVAELVVSPEEERANQMVPYGNGYLMVAGDGGVFNFSNLAFEGSLGDVVLNSDIVSITPLP